MSIILIVIFSVLHAGVPTLQRKKHLHNFSVPLAGVLPKQNKKLMHSSSRASRHAELRSTNAEEEAYSFILTGALTLRVKINPLGIWSPTPVPSKEEKKKKKKS